ncbi:hypothetical protein [Sphingobacterium griseoflavum]|uniref:Uncharacterized protein n=1 Tax=Sphingobacterium griseoflavum TaxID=1474952 RepID=A0ABQ3HXB7_9SPHI|nr:hypothetical protein [Sphingobacterium griseoflavum]GHE37109.1 hypothetical protein GCM10017764_20410 [Sphingobacterium griseoflavum]
MKGFEIRCSDRTFIVSAEPWTAVLIYQRYGYYYVDLEGWEIKPEERIIPRKRFSLTLPSDTIIQVDFKIIEKTTVSKLSNNVVEAVDFFPLVEEDFQQMTAKFHTLEALLRKEGII